MRSMRAPPPRGFTLIEIMIALAIIGIVAGLVAANLSGMSARARVTNTFRDTAQAVRRARAESFGRGLRTAFIVDTLGKRWWALEVPAGLTLDTFDPEAPGNVIAEGTLPEGVSFGPDGYGATFPAPLAGIPVVTEQPTEPNFVYCSFCRVDTDMKGFGMIVFEPDGRATFNSGAPAAPGQQFALTGTIDTSIRKLAVAVVARTGLVETFDQ